MTEYYIGLMSGTSIDGIDAVLVDFSGDQHQLKIILSYCHPWQADMAKKISQLCYPSDNEIERLGELNALIGIQFAKAVNTLLAQANIKSNQIKAIGSHGQTIRHHPEKNPAFSLQIGDPNRIACLTNIPTVADFRSKDIALGGQGAPLVPAFHAWLFAQESADIAVLNIGGIANITLLFADQTIKGFDTGTGNRLMDDWINRHQHKNYDHHGDWAKTGQINRSLLNHLLADPYFQLPYPKSTGSEYFNLAWLDQKLAQLPSIKPVDVQATLVELTAVSIANEIKTHAPKAVQLLVCGGGCYNRLLMQRLSLLLPFLVVETTASAGLDPDIVEAAAFAWLAKQHLNHQTGNIPAVTGAKRAAVLGVLCPV